MKSGFVLRRSSADPGCNQWLFELLLPFCGLPDLTSDPWQQQAVFPPHNHCSWIFFSFLCGRSKSIKSPFFPILTPALNLNAFTTSAGLDALSWFCFWQIFGYLGKVLIISKTPGTLNGTDRSGIQVCIHQWGDASSSLPPSQGGRSIFGWLKTTK